MRRRESPRQQRDRSAEGRIAFAQDGKSARRQRGGSGGERPRSEEVVLQNGIDGAEAILPANFLPLLIRAAIIGDAHLVDAAAGAGQLRGNLGFDTKAVFAKDELSNQ